MLIITLSHKLSFLCYYLLVRPISAHSAVVAFKIISSHVT